MREIKFRAWDKITKQVCPVVSLNYEINSGELINVILSECNAEFVSRNIEDVDLMQYTGLKDKNEVEIYEGDVVKQNYLWETNDPQTLGAMEVDREIIGVVGIDEYGSYTKTKESIYYWLEYLELPDQLEVIGNIYENLELLE